MRANDNWPNAARVSRARIPMRIGGTLVLAALACLNPATSQQQAHEFRVRISVNLVQVDATRH